MARRALNAIENAQLLHPKKVGEEQQVMDL